MEPAVSTRAQRSLALGSPLSDKFAKLFSNQYSAQNPNGLVNVGVAENTLMLKELDEFYKKNFGLDEIDYSYGTAMHGSKRLFSALCEFFNTHFDPVIPVEEQHLICGAGLAALLDQLVYVFCDEGDAMLVAKPFYSGFKNSIESRCLAKAIGVDVPAEKMILPESLDYFEKKIEQVRASGTKVTSIILCNPHNPLGITYPRSTLLAYCKFAEKHNLHLIVDEIYGLSVFDSPDVEEKIPFKSILSIDTLKEAGCDPSRVHMIYGASKDFCSNGFRLGFLVSQYNNTIRKSLRNMAIFMKVSSPSDQLFSTMLRSKEFMEYFIPENQKRLKESYEYVTKWCKKHDIEYVPASAGHFIFINLGKFAKLRLCEEDEDSSGSGSGNEGNGKITNGNGSGPMNMKVSPAKEARLLVELLDGGVYIGPGAAYDAMEPGWFRVTHSVKRPLMKLALERMEKVLGLDGPISRDEILSKEVKEMNRNNANEIAEAIKQLAVCGICC